MLFGGEADDPDEDEDDEDDESSSPPEALFDFSDLVISFRICSFIDILKFCNNNSLIIICI